MPTTKITNGVRAETREMPMLTLRAAFAPSTFNAEKRTVELVWTTGAKGLRRGWDGDYYEELEVSKKAIRLGRLNNGAPLLAVHDSWSLSAVVGVVDRAWIKGKEGHALVRFSERTDAAEVMRDVQAGILQNISVGYAVHKYERIRSVGSDGKPDGGIDTLRAVDWEPMEISIVPIGFDDGAKVRSSNTNKKNKVEILTRGSIQMNDDDQNQNEETADEIIEPATPTARAVRAERQRASAILNACRKGGLGDDFAGTLIRDGVPLAEARAAIVDEMALTQRRTQPDIRGQHLAETYSDPEFLSRSIGEALFTRVNPDHKPSEAAAPFVNRTLVELARECLHVRGVSTRLMAPGRIIERSLGGLHGTSDFAIALGDAMNRELMVKFAAADSGILKLGRRVTATDFRPRKPIMIGDFPTLTKTNEHGEFKNTTLVEAAATPWALDTFGHVFGMTRQLMVNDDLGIFIDIPAQLYDAAHRTEIKLVMDLFAANTGAGPTMADNVALFHSSHKNLAASGAVLSVTSLGAARHAMRQQTNISGSVINVQPRYLLVPSSLETAAEQLLASITPTEVGSVNPFAGRLELVTEPRLDAISSQRWYLWADPAVGPGALQLARLNGQAPTVDTQTGFRVDGVEFRITMDFAAGFVDHRSVYANPGAAPG